MISSRKNHIYKLCKKLNQRKYRRESGLYMVEGVNLVNEALTCGNVKWIIISEDCDSGMIKADGFDDIFFMEKSMFREITETQTSQGVIGLVDIPRISPGEFLHETMKEGKDRLLILDRIQDPGNMGTLIRTAEAFGFAGVVMIKGCVDPFAPKVVRAAAGALLRIPMLLEVDGGSMVLELKSKGWKVAGSGVSGGKPLWEYAWNGRTAIIIGNEGAGMDKELLVQVDVEVNIPMAENSESLNAAVAAGILMYKSVEECKQWKKG